MTNTTKFRIRVFGDPILRRRAVRVEAIKARHRDVLSAMAQLMYDASGIGLAAPQVGVGEAMIVVDAGSGLYKLINPRVIKRKGTQALEEGCLSVPGICIKVKRAREVLVKALDERGEPVTIQAQDLLACVLQHEIDHLRGKVIVDYASLWEKIKIKKKIAALKARAKDEELRESETKSCRLQL